MARKQERSKEEQRQRRLRGHHIKRGLHELGDLDAPKLKQARTDTSGTAAVTTSSPTVPSAQTSKPDAPSSSSFTLAQTVFGQDWREWLHAKQVLFSTDAPPSEKRQTLAALDLWRARVRKERPMPSYVESTIVLMDAVLCDEAADTPETRLVQLYGAALSRVVHLMTGSFASGKADTYRKRARQIQFPEEVVEVRQRVAHGALPALSELRWVCGLALQFLFQHYWLVQEPHARELSREAAPKAPRGRAAHTSGMSPAVAAAEAPQISVEDIHALLKELSDDDGSDVEENNHNSETHVVSTDSRTSIAGWTLQ